MLLLIIVPSHSNAQSVPADLTDLSLSELMEISVVEENAEIEQSDNWWNSSRLHVSYSFVHAEFNGFRNGTNNISDSALIGPANGVTYPILQDAIIQEAHSFEFAMDVNEWMTAHIKVPYILQSSGHHAIVGGPNFSDFTIRSEGFGDINMMGSFRMLRTQAHSFALNIGVSLPTGSIREKGDTPSPGSRNQLPYTMQIGSGTWDVLLGAVYQGSTGPLASTYTKPFGSFSWSLRVLGKIRTGRNSRGYRLGNRQISTVSVTAHPSPRFQPFIRLNTEISGKIRGTDDAFPGPIFPTPAANPNNFGGEKISLSGGTTIGFSAIPKGTVFDLLREHKISIEYGQPVYQSLNGPQAQERWHGSVNWSVDF
ncbi:MAG: hypothetical protein ACPGYT_01185 [Nitrospirales bacterium]